MASTNEGVISVLNWERTSISCINIKRSIDDGNIIMNPPHQRNVVHNNKWRSKIIESIMKYSDIPDLYFERESLSNPMMTSVDGKQRTMAIIGFMNDEFKYLEPEPAEMTNKLCSELSIALRNKFYHTLIGLKISNRKLTPDELTNIFRNMQATKQTSCGEQLNSLIDSHIINSCKDFIEDNEELYEDIIPNDNRYKRLELSARMVYGIFNANTNPDVSKSKTLINWCKDSENIFTEHCETVMKEILGIVNDCPTRHRSSKTWVLPILKFIICDIYPLNETDRDTTYEHFYDMLTGGEIKYPEVGGSHSATNVRYPILKDLFARYLNGENVYNQ